MKYALLLACPLLLAAAQPAPPAAPAPGTAERDAQCAIVLGTALWLMEHNTASPPPADALTRVREATTFYIGRLGARYPAGRIATAAAAARASLPPRGEGWQPIVAACGTEFRTLARAVSQELTPSLNQ